MSRFAALRVFTGEEAEIVDDLIRDVTKAKDGDLGDNRILRYDMTLPFLLTVRSKSTQAAVRLWSAGKVYGVCQSDSHHLEAFHQAEALWIDEVGKVDPWLLAGRILKSVQSLLPGSVVRILPTKTLRDASIRHRRHPETRGGECFVESNHYLARCCTP